MTQRVAVRKIFYGMSVVAVGILTVLLISGTFAPTTQGLMLQTSSHSGTASAGNRNDVYVFVSAYNEAGPIRGILDGSFSISILASPEGASPIKKTGITEPVTGIYKITLTPDLSSHRWAVGKYVIGITFTSANGSGVTVAEVVIGPS